MAMDFLTIRLAWSRSKSVSITEYDSEAGAGAASKEGGASLAAIDRAMQFIAGGGGALLSAKRTEQARAPQSNLREWSTCSCSLRNQIQSRRWWLSVPYLGE